MTQAKSLQLRRGTQTDHDKFTGLAGEATLNTTSQTLHTHDGTTLGGIALARADLDNIPAKILADKIFKSEEAPLLDTHFLTTHGVADDRLTNVSSQALAAKHLAFDTLTNVSQDSFVQAHVALDDLSNVSRDAIANKGIAKSDLSNVVWPESSETTAGIVSLATASDFPTNATKAVTPSMMSLYAQTLKAALPYRYIAGLIPSMAPGNILSVSVGKARDTTDTLNIELTLQGMTKNLSLPFALGNNQGGLVGTAALTTNQTWHLFIVSNRDGSRIDIVADTSVSGGNITNHPILSKHHMIYFRRIGSWLTDVSGKFSIWKTIEGIGNSLTVLMPSLTRVVNTATSYLIDNPTETLSPVPTDILLNSHFLMCGAFGLGTHDWMLKENLSQRPHQVLGHSLNPDRANNYISFWGVNQLIFSYYMANFNGSTTSYVYIDLLQFTDPRNS